MQNRPQATFRKFYLTFAIFWMVGVGLFFLLDYGLSSVQLAENIHQLLSGIKQIILIFCVFGIPIIFLFSLGIRLGERAILMIEKRVNEKKSNL